MGKMITVEACHECGERPIHIKKRGLCSHCYNKAYLNGTIQDHSETPSGIPFTLRTMDSTSKKVAINVMNKYGTEFFDDLDFLEKSHMTTLSEIGKKYRITRERVRQLFKILKGYPYTKPFHSLIKKRKKEDSLPCAHDPRSKIAKYEDLKDAPLSAQSEYLVFKKCEGLGFKVLPKCKPHIDLNINGHDVDVKAAAKKGKTVYKMQYYRFVISRYQRQHCDFIVGYIEPENLYYVFPKKIFEGNGNYKGKTIYIRGGESHHPRGAYKDAKYQEYKEAWHLLDDNQTIKEART